MAAKVRGCASDPWRGLGTRVRWVTPWVELAMAVDDFKAEVWERVRPIPEAVVRWWSR